MQTQYRNALVITAAICGLSLTSAIAHGDEYYDKFGIHASDIEAYKNLAIASCQAGLHENPDPLKPPANVSKLRHYAHLYGECQGELEKRHAAIGLLRFNDVLLGATCIALGSLDTDEGVDPVCNLKSYLPNP